MNDARDTQRIAPWNFLEPYEQLVRSLLPRATAISLFDGEANLRWSSETATEPALLTLVDDALAAARADRSSIGQLQMLDEHVPVYLCWLRDGAEPPLAVLAIACREAAGQPQSFSFVSALLKPVLECLRRELVSRRTLSAREREVELLLAVESAHEESRVGSADELRALLKSAGEHLGCALAALIVPEKSLVLMQPLGARAPDGALLARTHRQILSVVQMRRGPLVVNRVRTGAGGFALPFRILACPLRHPSGRTMGVLTLFRREEEPEFTDRETRLGGRLARKAVQLIESSYDAASGLLTRPAFEQRAAAAAHQRPPDAQWSLLYIDVDQLHVINESFGMHVGDTVLAQVSELVRRRLPPRALAARISGDCFAVLLPVMLHDAADFAESLREAAQQIGALFGDARLRVSVSIGVAEWTAQEELSHAFAAAESACKAAKDRGRNRTETCEPTDLSIIRRVDDINVAGNLRLAIAENRLRLDGQLILPLGTALDSRPHFELLLRMIGEDGQTIGPERFLSAANRYQLMPEMDRWVVREAIARLKPYAPMLVARQVVFALNFSGQTIGDPGFEEFLVREIEASGLDPAIFCFELTESAAIANVARAELLMRRLRQLGCEVALDDFGTGLSSLSYLRQLPVSMLKIDGSFVRDILKDARCESMVRAIAQLAHSMGLVTVAEYVETDEILARVSALGVDYGQGFAIGHPTPLPELLTGLPVFTAAARLAGHEDTDAPGEDTPPLGVVNL